MTNGQTAIAKRVRVWQRAIDIARELQDDPEASTILRLLAQLMDEASHAEDN